MLSKRQQSHQNYSLFFSRCLSWWASLSVYYIEPNVDQPHGPYQCIINCFLYFPIGIDFPLFVFNNWQKPFNDLTG